MIFIDSEANGNYSTDEEIKFLTRSIESSLCDYSDAYILVTGNITVAGGNANTKVANFYDQSINDSVKQYDEIYQQSKVMTMQPVVY